MLVIEEKVTKDYIVVSDISQVPSVIKTLSASRELAFDLEFDNLNPWFSRPLLWQLSDGINHFVGIESKVPLTLLSGLLYTKTLIGFNLVTEYMQCAVRNIKLGPLVDVMLAYQVAKAGLLFGSTKSASLKVVSKLYLEIDLNKDLRQEFIVHDGTNFTHEQLDYAIEDVRNMHKLWGMLKEELIDKGALQIALEEFRLIPCFGDLQLCGQRIDRPAWVDYVKELEETKNKLEEELMLLLQPGYDKSIKAEREEKELSKPVDLQIALFSIPLDEKPVPKLNMASPIQVKKALRGVGIIVESTDKGVLDKLNFDDPVRSNIIALLKERSVYSKAVTTYGSNMLNYVSEEDVIWSNIYQLGASATGRCVAAGTKIEVLRDVNKHPLGINIEDVIVGDLVYSYDADRNITVKPVLNVLNNGIRPVVRIHWLSTSRHNRGFIDVTPDHLIRLSSGDYVEARNLKSGDSVLSLSRDNVPTIITLIEELELPCQVYDLEVADTHNFIAGGICVHNCSSGNPVNFQNIPSRGSMGTRFRQLFIAREPTHKMIIADYSSLEQRIAANESKDPVMLKIFREGLDMHSVAAASIFGLSYEEFEVKGGYDRIKGEYTNKSVKLSNGMTIKYMRDECTKTCSFASNYGGNWKTLRKTLRMPDAQLQKIFEGYVRTYKVLFAFMDRYGHAAIVDGITCNSVGRFRLYGPTKWERLNQHMSEHFQQPVRDEYQVDGVRRQGLNMPIQSLAADIVKRAMFYTHKELAERGLLKVWGPGNRVLYSGKPGACIVNQVHDELVINSDEEVAEEVAEIVSRNMLRVEQELLLDVPPGISCHIGDSWADK